MSSRLGRSTVFVLLVVATVLMAVPAQSQIVIQVNKDVFFRIGAQLQFWADEQQDATTRGYVQNLYIRRGRFLVTGQMAPNVSFFFQTDNPNLGKVPKSLNTGFVLQDFWAQWRVNDAFMLSAGKFLVPLSRAELTSTASFLTLDISPTATVFSGPTQSDATRDTGVQAQGYVADGRLEYRAGIFTGIRGGTPAGRSAFRRAAYLQYDFLEKERGYVYAGTNLGHRKILAVSAGYDGQSRYKAWSAALAANLPVNGGDEFAVLAQHNNYNGGTFIPAIPDQRDELVEAGYYIHQAKIQPFAKFEQQKFAVTSNPSKDVTRYALGAHYYVFGTQNLKFTGQWYRVHPANGAINSTNEFTIEMQFFYY